MTDQAEIADGADTVEPEPTAADPAEEAPAETNPYSELSDQRSMSERIATARVEIRRFVAAQPRRRVITVPLVVVALLALAITAMAWPDYPLGPDVEVDSRHTLDQLADLPSELDLSTAEQSESEAEDIPVTDAEPKWEYADADDGELVRVDGGGYVYDGRIGFDADGKRIWKSDAGGSVAAGGTVIFASSDLDGDHPWPGRDKTTVSDAKTGEKLWTDSSASFSSVWHDQVYLSRCQGGQDGELGECVVTAHDAHSGATLWSRPTYASTSVVEAAPDGSFVVFESHVTAGEDIRYTVVDTATGAVLPGGFDQDGYGGGEVFVIDGLVIAVGEDDNPADDCRLPVTAVDVRTGAEVWDRKLGVDIEEGGDYCGDLDGQYGEHIMAYNGDREPVVINLRDGKTEWTAPDRSRPTMSDGEYAMVRGEDGELRFYDIDADKKLWELPGGVGVGGLGFDEDHVYVDTEDYFVEDDCWIRVDLKSGDAERYPGSCAGFGDDWLATVDEDSGLRVYELD